MRNIRTILMLSAWGLLAMACAVQTPTRLLRVEDINAQLAEMNSEGQPETGTAEARFGMHFEPVEFEPPVVNHATLGNGMTLDHYEEPGIPLVTILVRVATGSVQDPADKVGLAELTAQVIRNGGTKEMDGDTLDRELESRGAQLSVESDREETWFRLSVLEEDALWGMQLLQELLTEPALPESKMDEARGRWLVDLQQRLDVPMQVGRNLFPQLIVGKGNPWGWTMTERTLNNITLADVRKFYSQHFTGDRMKVGVTGSLDFATAQVLSGKTLGKIASIADSGAKLPEMKPIQHTTVYVVPRDISQNVIYFGHLGVNRFDADKFPIKVFNLVLSGGFTSRLFKEVRSNRGLAYSVGGAITDGTVKGRYYNAVLTKAESSVEALDLMLEINRNLQQEAPSEEEMEIARQSDVNSFVFFFDTSEKIVRQNMTLDAYGYPKDYLETYVSKLKAVTPEDVRNAAAKHIDLDHLVVLVVGKVDAALQKRLETMGPVTVIEDAELRADWL